MVQIKMPNIDSSSIISNKIYIADKVTPIAIQRNKFNKEIYDILFAISSDMDSSVIYFQISLKIEDNLDKNCIENRPIFINNILRDKVKNKAFKQLMESFEPEKNFYIGDFNFINDGTTNHIIKGIKELTVKDNKKYFELINMHVSRHMYIILNLYLDNIMEPFSDVENIESFFINKELRSMRFEKIEQVKLVATCKCKRKNRGAVITYNTHYEMNCGPKMFKFNYEVVSKENYDVKEPLAESIFDPEYSQYNDKFIGVVSDKDCFYIIIYDKDDKIKGLKISKELIDKTNLLDPTFIFSNYSEPEYEEDITEDQEEFIDNINSIENPDEQQPKEEMVLIPVNEQMMKAMMDGTISAEDIVKSTIGSSGIIPNDKKIILPNGMENK